MLCFFATKRAIRCLLQNTKTVKFRSFFWNHEVDVLFQCGRVNSIAIHSAAFATPDKFISSLLLALLVVRAVWLKLSQVSWFLDKGSHLIERRRPTSAISQESTLPSYHATSISTTSRPATPATLVCCASIDGSYSSSSRPCALDWSSP